MGTYYGYVKQDIESQVDWGAVGKTFTDMLSTESTRRETLKKEIDDNTVTDLEKLAQIPKGSSEEYNKWTTDAADKISQARLLQVKELKAGRLSLKDYNNYRQNTVSGVNNMVSTIKSYNAWFENGMKRAEKMESGAAELWKNSLLESMKFKDTVPNIGLDGSMSVTKQVMNPKTGLMEVSSNPADAFSFSSMLDFGKKQFDRFKAKESLDELDKVVGQYTKVINQGNIGTVTDIWQTDKSGKFVNPEVGAIQNQVRASISNPNNAMSVLVDFKGVTPSGGKYEFTNDPNDPRLKGANKDDVIFMDSTMSPKLTEGQMKRAEDIMIEGLKARSGHVETAFTAPRYAAGTPTDASIKANAERRNTAGYVKDTFVMQTGSPSQFQSTVKDRVTEMNSLRKKYTDPKIGEVQRTDTEFIIPVYKYNPATKLNDLTYDNVSRVDADGNPLPVEQVGRELSRVLTPIKGSWENTLQDVGGYGNAKPTMTGGKGGSNQQKVIPSVTLSSVPMKSSEGKSVNAATALKDAILNGGIDETATIVQNTFDVALGDLGSKIKVSHDGDNIIIEANGKRINYEYKDEMIPDLTRGLNNIINNNIKTFNAKNAARNKPTAKGTTKPAIKVSAANPLGINMGND